MIKTWGMMTEYGFAAITPSPGIHQIRLAGFVLGNEGGDPIATNSVLGRYTNFMNLLDLAAVALPAGRARGGKVPWGITLAAPAGSDMALLDLCARLLDQPRLSEPATPTTIPVVVCGAHMEGLALHWQLAERGATLRLHGRTAPCYRLFAMPASGSIPPRPALVHDEANGAAIEVEVWDLTASAFGDFVARIPAPLGIGKVTLADGQSLPGFIAEPRATHQAGEITHLGGWGGLACQFLEIALTSAQFRQKRPSHAMQPPHTSHRAAHCDAG